MDGVETHVDKYGYVTFSTPKANHEDFGQKPKNNLSFSFAYPSGSIPVCGKKSDDSKSTFLMRDVFFACHCKRNQNGTRTLILNGNDLDRKIGRRFKDWDVPYLALFLSKNDDVTKLHLPNNQINSAGFISLIDFLVSHNQFDELDLRNNQVRTPGIKHMYQNQAQLKLSVLVLNGNKLNVESSKIIALMVKKNKFIKCLGVAENDQTESSLIYFTSVLRSNQPDYNETLKILDLSRPIPQCRFSKFDSSHIAVSIGLMLHYNKSLEELYLQKFEFSCHDMEDMITNAVYNRNLVLLDLSCNNIGDFGVKWISMWLEKQPPLRTLLLSHNIISNGGISELSKGINLSKLRMIDLSYNRFDDIGGVELLNSFKKSPFIESFRIFGNRVASNTARIIETWLLANIVNQDDIDVRPYLSDCNLVLAYYQREK